MVEPYLVVCAALLLGSVLAWALPLDRRSFDDDYEDGWDLAPREVAYLRRGPYGVVLTVLADLHGCGSVDLSGRSVRRLDPRHDLDDRLAVAVYAGLTWVRRPWLLAWLPGVRRACAPLRAELLARGLLPPRRRRIFAAALLVYAGGLATATMLERDLQGSTVVSALGVWGAAGLLSLGPRRTVAGGRELRAHRRALARVAEPGGLGAEYLADLVAAYGAIALREARLVPAGALGRPLPAEPWPARAPAPVLDPSPVLDSPQVRAPSPVAEPSVVEPSGGAPPPVVEPSVVVPTPRGGPVPIAGSAGGPAAWPVSAPRRSWTVFQPVLAPAVVELPVRRSERVRRPERLRVAA